MGLLAVGIANIEINNKQYQQNDQSQKTTVSTETKVITINDMNNGRIRNNIAWVNIENTKTIIFEEFEKLDIWQQKYAKIFGNYDYCYMFYPIIQAHTNVVRKKIRVTNDTHTVNSNDMKVEVKSFWKF